MSVENPTENPEDTIPEIPENLVSILEGEEDGLYSGFSHEQLSELGRNLGGYLQQASNQEQLERMMKVFLDEFGSCFGIDHEAADDQERELLQRVIQYLILEP